MLINVMLIKKTCIIAFKAGWHNMPSPMIRIP